MLNKAKKLVLIGCVAVGLTGCDGLLDTEPSQSVSPEVALANIEGIEAILTSSYNRLQDQFVYGQKLTIAPDVLADNTVQGPTPSGRLQDELRNAFGTGAGSATTYYRLYQLINEVNYIIQGVDETEALQETLDRIEGEALFLRALAYHNLARVYSYEPTHPGVNGWDRGVVIRTEPVRDVADADLRGRSTVSQVYDQIESDLMSAIALLAEVGGDSPERATQAAAEALLARVYLYEGNWEGAADYATRAMNNTTATLLDASAVGGSFAAELHPEAVFQLSVGVTESLGRNESLAAVTRPSAGGNNWGDVIPSPELLTLFEDDDARWDLFEEAEGATFSRKYASTVGPHTDDIPLIRYPELLLIRAEAYAEMNQPGDAETDLNTLRAARDASDLELSTRAQAIDAVMAERRRELHFEGHRFFDLKRKGMDITKAAGANTATIESDDTRILMPLPTREVDLNENLEQNPGY